MIPREKLEEVLEISKAAVGVTYMSPSFIVFEATVTPAACVDLITENLRFREALEWYARVGIEPGTTPVDVPINLCPYWQDQGRTRTNGRAKDNGGNQ